METQLFTILDIEKDKQEIHQAASILRAGGLVAIPTETVYGLAANALDANCAAAIYAAKGRPSDNPLIVHVSDLEMIKPLVKAVPPELYPLAERFWPGAMTVIMEKSDLVPHETSGGLSTVAIRIPSHPVARELIGQAGVPLAAPSANLSGSPSPTCARHCVEDLTGRIDAIVDGGACSLGVESSVLTLCTDPPKLLRPGTVTLEQLREVLPSLELDAGVFEKLPEDRKVSSPGMKYKHYAPKAKVILVRGSQEQFLRFLQAQTGSFGVLCFEGDSCPAEIPRIIYGAEGDAASQAHGLFDALRQIDKQALDLVYARISDSEGIGQAVYNRLLRAAGFDEIML